MAIAVNLFFFTNCGQNEFSQTDEASQLNVANEADFFLWLDRYKKRAAELREVNTDLSNTLASELEANIQKIEDLLNAEIGNKPHHDPSVLAVRDYLDASYADGGDLIIKLNFDEQITKLKEKDIELEGKIASLESNLKADLDRVKAELEKKISDGDAENLSIIQNQLLAVQSQINSLKAADQQIFNTISILKIDIEANRVEIENNKNLIIQVEKGIQTALENSQQELKEQLAQEKQELLDKIAKLENENKNLQSDLTSLSNSHNELASNFITFKQEVESRFSRVEARISVLEGRLETLDNTVLVLDQRMSDLNDTVVDLQNSTAASLQNLKQSILDVRAYTEQQVLTLKQLNLELKQEIAKQEDAFQSLMTSQREVAGLQDKMCKANDNRNKCSGAETDLDSDCCMSLDTLNCELIFGDADQASALNQCNLIVMTLKNHDEQLKAIKEVDENQNTMISGLLSDIKNLSQQVDQITSSIEEISRGLQAVQSNLQQVTDVLSKMDARLLLLEFKAARSEAIAALHERSDHYLGWITRRYADVRNQFCKSRAHRAYNMSDYYVARQNYDYCLEKLSQLKRAKELVHVAKSFANGLGSINVDKSCTATFVNPDTGLTKPVESMSITEAVNPEIFTQIFNKCKTGPALAKAMIVNVVALHRTIGPDFRSAEYMSRKSKIVQLMYFGKVMSEVNQDDIRFFENVDPTSTFNEKTIFGRVERVFKMNYVKNRLRDSRGNYIYDLRKVPGNVPGLAQTYTEAEMLSASNDYLAKLGSLELKDQCQNCGYKVVSRNITSRGGKTHFSFPQDAKNQCPIHSDNVITKGKDGAYYSYKLYYSRHKGASEIRRAYYANGNGHMPIAKSETDAINGEFAYCSNRLNNKIIHRFGMPNTHLRGQLVLSYSKPYSRTHGKPQCRRYHFRCVPQVGNWEYSANRGPASTNVMHYLSGFTEDKILNYCKQSGRSYVYNKRPLSRDEKAHMRTYLGPDLESPLSTVQSNTDAVTQLSSKYWQHKDGPVTYGVNDLPTSKDEPFYSTSINSHSSTFFRTVFAPVNMEIDVQQCYDPL